MCCLLQGAWAWWAARSSTRGSVLRRRVESQDGADLCHLFCVEEAAVPIKSYSSELIVHLLLRSDASLAGFDESKRAAVLAEAVERIVQVLPRLDTLVIGPGLGRDASVQEITRQIIAKAKESNLPLVLDGDALFLVSLEPETIKGYKNVILTPNAVRSGKVWSGGVFRCCLRIGWLGIVDGVCAVVCHHATAAER